jgi:RNA polymerase sigma factor (sigma-70 family)
MVAFTATVLSDEDLAEAASAGDEDAFADLRQRYAAPLYDLLARMTRNRAEAADLTRATFERARRGMSGRHTGQRLRPWLFALARQVALDALRRRHELCLEDEAAMIDVEGVEAEHGSLVTDAWRAAAALDPDHYAVLHYQLRAGLHGDELAEAMAMRPDMVYITLVRAHDALDDAFALLQFARRRRQECAGIELILGLHPPPPLDAAARHALRRHMERCAKCRQSRAEFVNPARLLSALSPVAPPRGVPLRPPRALPPLPAARTRPGPRRRREQWALPAAALGFLLLATSLLVRGPGPDRTAPVDPQLVLSTSHVPWVASSQRSVEVEWSGTADPAAKGQRHTGLAGYSLSWSGQPGDVPDGLVQTSTERSTSPELGDGTWWFHMRPIDGAGNAGPPVHLGPFVITEPSPAPTPSPPSSPPPPRQPRAL